MCEVISGNLSDQRFEYLVLNCHHLEGLPKMIKDN